MVVPPKLPISEMAVARTPQVMRLASMTYDEHSPRFLRHLQELDHPSKKNWTTVERICFEMTGTEKDYVSDVAALVDRFLDPLAAFAEKYYKLKEELPAFTALRCAAHFILGVHRELLKLLEPPQQRRFFNFSKALNSQEARSGPLEAVTRVTTAFASTIDYMKVYAIYCANYLPATEELKSHAKLLDAFTLAQADCSQPPFDAISDLIKPVQRICRYSLLFRSLVQNATSPEEALLSQQALESVQRVSDLVNARVRDAENNVRLVSLNDSIDNSKLATKLELLRPGRTLLNEMSAAVQVMDRRARLARVFHLRAVRNAQKSSCQQTRDTSSLNSEMELLGGSNSVHDGDASTLRESLSSSGLERNKDRQQVILLSDALLIARNGSYRLRVRRHICLSCATVVEVNETDDDIPTHGACSKSFALLASKSGCCNCHNLSPSTLKRPVKRRYSLSRSTSLPAVDTQEADSVDVSSPASPSRRRFRRTARQYIVHCESEQKKKEFVALLRGAIARCARSEEPPRSSVSLAATNLSAKLWQSIKQRDFSQTLSVGYSSLLRRRANAMSAACNTEEVNGSTDESNSDEPPPQTERLLRTSRLATSGAA
ncbi:Myosin-M heavy chain [Phytophthora ramorum]|uniref:Myosin-M heavy chain n=1 Tax=Phytophthora ramorum TaxID=164328 RepID=UPI0030ABDD2A|nr:Myosin-M heavy chain [Phytophthora ramorum]